MWFPSLSCQELTLPPTNGRSSNISTWCPASAKSIAATIPANPAPTIPILRDSSFFLPGPPWARAMRFSFRKESFPTCDLAPSEVKVAVSYKGKADRPLVLLGTNAEHGQAAMADAAARKVILRLGNMVSTSVQMLFSIYPTADFRLVSSQLLRLNVFQWVTLMYRCNRQSWTIKYFWVGIHSLGFRKTSHYVLVHTPDSL
mmetsp:Transcript_31603/g.74372  ORF Transcript_31603/g.74372 Transcript_31603/m.74372 type:complete len:201 (+) Transcript_31603:1527-2129(+)